MNDHKRAMLLKTQARLARLAHFKQLRSEGLNQCSAMSISSELESNEVSLVKDWRVA